VLRIVMASNRLQLFNAIFTCQGAMGIFHWHLSSSVNRSCQLLDNVPK
jgi:hypothetical protein